VFITASSKTIFTIGFPLALKVDGDNMFIHHRWFQTGNEKDDHLWLVTRNGGNN